MRWEKVENMRVSRGRILKDPDGAWLWEYRMDLFQNRSMLVYILVPIYVVMGIFVIYGYFTKMDMSLVIPVAGGMSLICTALALLIYLLSGLFTRGRYRIPYYMNETFITVHMGNPAYKAPEKWDDNKMIRFDSIEKIRLKRKVDMILLVDILPFQVYVPKEFYNFILEFILERVKPRVREKFEKRYGKIEYQAPPELTEN